MKKNLLVIIGVCLIIAFCLTACVDKDERDAVSTVRQYVKLMNAEDSAGVYSITHQSARTLGYKNDLDLQFGLYDIKIDIEELSFDKIEDGNAYVPFVATMKKTDDSDFKNIRLHGTFLLSKEGDEWKLLGMVYDAEKDVEYLDE